MKCSECNRNVPYKRLRQQAKTCSPECSTARDRRKARIRISRARREGLGRRTLADRARNLALGALRRRHPQEFRTLYLVAKKELSAPTRYPRREQKSA